jgi:hypothetical protein
LFSTYFFEINKFKTKKHNLNQKIEEKKMDDKKREALANLGTKGVEYIREKKPKLLIGTPCYGGLCHVGYMESLLRLQKILMVIGIEYEIMTFGSESLIPRARNAIVSAFLSKKFTHLMFIDADITFQAESVLRLLIADYHISGVAYPKKGLKWQEIANEIVRMAEISKEKNTSLELNPADLVSKTLDYVLNFKKGDEGSENQIRVEAGFIEISELGTGFMMIRSEVFDALRQEYPDLKYVNDVAFYDQVHPDAKDNFWLFFDCVQCPVSKRYLSEDYAFCQRWKDCGGKIFVDITQPLTHTGIYHYSGILGSKFVTQPPPSETPSQ